MRRTGVHPHFWWPLLAFSWTGIGNEHAPDDQHHSQEGSLLAPLAPLAVKYAFGSVIAKSSVAMPQNASDNFDIETVEELHERVAVQRNELWTGPANALVAIRKQVCEIALTAHLSLGKAEVYTECWCPRFSTTCGGGSGDFASHILQSYLHCCVLLRYRHDCWPVLHMQQGYLSKLTIHYLAHLCRVFWRP